MNGFLCTDQFPPYVARRVYFMDCKGKDISFIRWGIDLYYEPHLAMTHFEESEEAYNKFIVKHKNECFNDYTDYLKSIWVQS